MSQLNLFGEVLRESKVFYIEDSTHLDALAYRHIGNDSTCPRCGAAKETINHAIFECPPARQAWALSPIPSAPDIFPASSIFTNLDFLFWRAKEWINNEDTIGLFPWLMWFIWKARNRKVFENLNEDPRSTLEKARLEEEAWRKANETDEEEDHARAMTQTTIPPNLISSVSLSCFIDGSWADSDSISGQGWIVQQGNEIIHLGLKGSRRSLSPLYAEFDTLLWAMQCFQRLQLTSACFFSDCLELINMIYDPEEWPSFSSELEDFRVLRNSFPCFCIKFISRKFNTRADSLAKSARARGLLFSHVSSSVPDWLSLEESQVPNS